MEKGTIVWAFTQILVVVAYGVFFFWTQVLWTDIGSGDCLSGYNLIDFLNWLFLLFITVWAAIMLAIGVCIGICCGPCIYAAVRDYYREQAD